MSLLSQLTDEMKTAMKSGDKKRLSTIRMLISAIRYAQIDTPEMTKEDEIKVLQKEAKKRRESIVAYREADRAEQLAIEEDELKLIEEYLPTMMGEEEVRAKVKEIIGNGEYANFGMVMNAVMRELKGKADGSVVSRMVKEVYQG
jgi:hypothetical protein